MIFIKDRVYVPVDNIPNLDKVDKLFVKEIFNDEKCSVCEYQPERPNDTCETCPGYMGSFKLYNERTMKSVDYIGFPRGNLPLIKKVVPDIAELKKKDLRTATPFKHKIKFVGTLRPHQVEALEALTSKGSGFLIAPPRSGKTVVGTALAVSLGMKTLILASQNDFLDQFYETIMGSPKLDAMTNIPDLEGKKNKKICGICNSVADFKKFDIALATYQTFATELGMERFKEVKDLFGVIIIDEAHRSNAKVFARVVNGFSAKYKFGLTATHARKDKMEIISSFVLGPIRHTTKIETLRPRVEFIETGTNTSYDYKNWVYAMRFLEKFPGRNEMIVKHVIADLKKGHNIVIPVMYRSHVTTLVNMINSAWGKKIAEEFVGGGTKLNKIKRRETILRARGDVGKMPKTRVVVGIRSIIQEGINIPSWSCLYNVMPIANPPKYHQETSRILTPLEGKQQPLIKHFIDLMPQSRGCARVCVYQTYIKEKFLIEKEQWAKINPYLKKGKMVSHKIKAGSDKDKVGHKVKGRRSF